MKQNSKNAVHFLLMIRKGIAHVESSKTDFVRMFLRRKCLSNVVHIRSRACQVVGIIDNSFKEILTSY